MNSRVRVLTYQLQKDAERHELVHNIPVTRIPYPNLRFAGEVVGICGLLQFLWKQRSEFQIIQIHGVGFAAAALVIAGKLIGKQLIVHVTGSETYRYIYRSRWRRLLVWSAIRHANLFIAASEEMRKFLAAHHVPAFRIIVIPRGLEIPPNDRAEKIDQLKQGQLRQKTAIFVSRLVIEKGLEDLLYAWQLVCQGREDCRLWIVGEGG
jgi:glycosyltransferase involved in cell wall biosynthesis